jgi:MFS family permease
VTYAIIEGPGRGWGDPAVLGAAIVAALCLTGFVRHALRTPEPLIDLRFFRSVPFAGATVIAVCEFAALGGFLFLNALYLQNARGLSALHAGLYLLPMAAMSALLAPLSGRLVGTRGPRPSLVAAGAATLASALLMAVFDAETHDVTLFAAYVLFGIGFGMVNSPITNTAVSGMPRAQAGVAAAVASTSRQVGQALGVAVIGAVLAAGTSGGRSGGAAFVAAARPAYWVLAGCAAVVLVLGVLTTGRRAARSAERTAALFETGEPAPGEPHVTGATTR